MVNCPSAYNAILGRLTLNQMRVVTVTYHLLMRFLTKEGVGKVRGDQVTAQECYVPSLKAEPIPKETISIYSLEVQDERIVVEPGEASRRSSSTLITLIE